MNPKSDSTKTLDIVEIMKLLPHRYPFLMVDKVIHYDLEKLTITGQKNVSCNEEFFQGHFPNMPIMPGVLIIEALAQVGVIMANLANKLGDKKFVFLSVNNVKFRNPVKPGDVLFLHGDSFHLSSKGGRFKGLAKVDDKIAVEGELGFAFVDKI